MRGGRYTYVGTYLAHLNSHGLTDRRLGYNWFVIDRTQKDERNAWLPFKIIRHCHTRAEARELCNALNERGFRTLEVVNDTRVVS